MDRRRPPTTRLKIMLDGEPKDTCPTLSKDEVDRFPQKFLEVLFTRYVSEDYGDFGTVITVNDQSHYIPIKRSIQWITKGESADFLNPRKLEVVKRQGDQRTLAFDQQVHADDIAYNASQATHLCVVQDLDLYTFSISLEMVDLQRHLSERLRSYPVFENEVKKILTRLYAKDSQVVQHIDQDLRDFIADRIKCFHRMLIADNSFTEVLRSCISPQDELHSLLRHKHVDDLTLEKALQVVRPAVNAPDWAESLLQDFDRMHLNASANTPPNTQPFNPTSDPRRSSHVSNDGSQTPDEAGHILRAIYRDKRIVKAERGCTGTLLSSGRPGSESPKVPNNDFQVKRHQILVELPDRRQRFGGRNVRVYMSYEGQIGELYENLKLTPIQDETLPPLPSPSTQGAKRNRAY